MAELNDLETLRARHCEFRALAGAVQGKERREELQRRLVELELRMEKKERQIRGCKIV